MYCQRDETSVNCRVLNFLFLLSVLCRRYLRSEFVSLLPFFSVSTVCLGSMVYSARKQGDRG